MDEIMSFNDRNENGNKSVLKTIEYCNKHNLMWNYVVDPMVWKKLEEAPPSINKQFQQKFYKNLDLIYGDLFIECFQNDIKTNYVSLKSIQNFQGDFFIVWESYSDNSFVFIPKDLKNFARNNEKNTVLLASADPGFSLEQLKLLNHTTLDNIFLYFKNK